MKKIVQLVGICFLLAGATHASVLSVINWDGNNTGTYFSVWNVTAAADGNDVVYSWTRTGDLDGLGTADDTLTFDLRHKAFTGSSYSDPDVTLGTSYNLGGATDQHFGPAGDLDNNQSFRLSMEKISFTQGEALGWTATFDGFSAISKYGSDANYYVGIDDAEVFLAQGDGTFPFTGPLDTLVITSSGLNNSRFRDLGFSYTTGIPEPATLGLVALFGGGILFVRRRLSI